MVLKFWSCDSYIAECTALTRFICWVAQLTCCSSALLPVAVQRLASKTALRLYAPVWKEPVRNQSSSETSKYAETAQQMLKLAFLSLTSLLIFQLLPIPLEDFSSPFSAEGSCGESSSWSLGVGCLVGSFDHASDSFPHLPSKKNWTSLSSGEAAYCGKVATGQKLLISSTDNVLFKRTNRSGIIDY